MNEGEYYSLQTVLGSGSSFKPFPRPEGQRMNSLYAIRQCHYPRIGPNNSFPILQIRVNITACRLFWVPEARLSHSSSRGTEDELPVCYMTVPLCQNWPK